MYVKQRRGLVALAAVTASVALSGIGAGGAQAAACGGANIEGQGSSLQNAAQTIWTTGTAPTGFNNNMNGGCTTSPTVRYASSSSGACATQFGGNGGAINTTFAFCGTDDALTETQTTSITTATGGKALTIPVAQAAIAIVTNPPSGCTVSSISATQIEQVFRGSIATWSGITGASGGANCNATINRVVRNDSSGTSYQLKHYLSTQNAGAVHGTLTWANLQSTANNTTWPGTVTKSQTGCGTVMALPCSGGANSGSGGGDEVKTIATTASSIGYAALADARSNRTALVGTFPGLTWVSIPNSSSIPINPSTNGVSTTKAKSNCPTATGSYGTLPTATGVWDSVYESVAASSASYPICTLTYDVALTNYPASYAAGSAQTVKDYLGYVLTTLGGQADALNSSNDYQVLPTDAQSAGSAGVGEITP
jgi:hypothetical protein